MSYVDGFLVPVPEGKKDAYRAMAATAAPIFVEYGALHVAECWGDNLAHGKTTDFYMGTKAADGENVVFSWIVWPSKEVRDAGWAKVMADERMKPPAPEDLPFDGPRMVWGGFDMIVEAGAK